MSARSNAVLALSASVAVVLGLALVPSAATAHTGTAAIKIPKIPKMPKTKSVKLQLDVAGHVEVRELKDTTSVCVPGVTYTRTHRYTFETGKFVKTRLSIITGVPGYDSPITVSPFSRPAGSAEIDGRITGYRTTNYCDPKVDKPELLHPLCVDSRGKTSVKLMSAGESLTGKPMMLSVDRIGGVDDDLSCPGGIAADIKGTDVTDRAIISTSMAPGVSLALPIGVGSNKLFKLKRKDRLQRTIVADGPCDLVRVFTYPGWEGGVPDDGELKADGDCWLTSKIVLTIRRHR